MSYQDGRAYEQTSRIFPLGIGIHDDYLWFLASSSGALFAICLLLKTIDRDWSSQGDVCVRARRALNALDKNPVKSYDTKYPIKSINYILLIYINNYILVCQWLSNTNPASCAAIYV